MRFTSRPFKFAFVSGEVCAIAALSFTAGIATELLAMVEGNCA